MPTYTITLNDVDDAAMTEMVADMNIGREANGQTAFKGVQDFLDDLTLKQVAPVRKQFDDRTLEPIITALRAAPLDVRAAAAAVIRAGKG